MRTEASVEEHQFPSFGSANYQIMGICSVSASSSPCAWVTPGHLPCVASALTCAPVPSGLGGLVRPKFYHPSTSTRPKIIVHHRVSAGHFSSKASSGGGYGNKCTGGTTSRGRLTLNWVPPRCCSVPPGGPSSRSCTLSQTIFPFQKGKKGLLKCMSHSVILNK